MAHLFRLVTVRSQAANRVQSRSTPKCCVMHVGACAGLHTPTPAPPFDPQLTLHKDSLLFQQSIRRGGGDVCHRLIYRTCYKIELRIGVRQFVTDRAGTRRAAQLHGTCFRKPRNPSVSTSDACAQNLFLNPGIITPEG
jgi:hypothetical protein